MPTSASTEAELLPGDVLMDQIRSRQREIVGEEERLLAVRTRQATTLSRRVAGYRGRTVDHRCRYCSSP